MVMSYIIDMENKLHLATKGTYIILLQEKIWKRNCHFESVILSYIIIITILAVLPDNVDTNMLLSFTVC